MAKRYSKNQKLNNVLTMIEEQLLSIHSTREESIAEIKHYMDNFPKEVDYNLYQYGNLLYLYHDIQTLYHDAGYRCYSWSNQKLEDTYKRQIGYVARELMK